MQTSDDALFTMLKVTFPDENSLFNRFRRDHLKVGEFMVNHLADVDEWLNRIQGHAGCFPLSYRYLVFIKQLYGIRQVGNGFVTEQDGEGFFGDLFNKILPTRKDFPPKVRETIAKYRDYYIKGIQVARTPVESYVKNILNTLSLGQLQSQITKSDYDDIFHLFMVVILENGPDILVEKNEVVSMEINKSRNVAGIITIPLNGKRITFGELIDKAVKAVGPSIYLYDHVNNNCQVFIRDILKANGLLTPEANSFIIQNVEQIMKTSPEFVNSLARFSTEAAAKFDRLLKGGHLF